MTRALSHEGLVLPILMVAVCTMGMIGCFEEEAPQPPPPPSPAGANAPPSVIPTIPPTPGASVTPSPSPLPGTAPAPSAGSADSNPASATSPQVSGAYELRWIEAVQGRQEMPQALLARMPTCRWGRWLWVFGAGGALRVHNELLCDDAQLGTGICRAEFETRVRWQQQSFIVPSPVTSRSLFVALRPQGGSWPSSGGRYNSTTIRCNVNLNAITARLTDVVPGTAPNRPQSLTLDIGNNERIHLVATEEEVDLGAIMLRSLGASPQTPPAS